MSSSGPHCGCGTASLPVCITSVAFTRAAQYLAQRECEFIFDTRRVCSLNSDQLAPIQSHRYFGSLCSQPPRCYRRGCPYKHLDHHFRPERIPLGEFEPNLGV